MTSSNRNMLIYQGQFFIMSSPFNLQIEDQCLRFIRDDSYQENSDLFQNIHPSSKPHDHQLSIQEEDIIIVDNSGKRARKQNNPKSAGKKKVFYRDKMAHLISEQEMQKCEGYNYGDFSQIVRGKSPISRQEQLRRNRESAKHSRQRRKQYVQTLQLKNEEYQKKIQQLTHRLRQVEFERDRLKDDHRSYIKSFLASKSQAYQHMSQVLKKSQKRSSDQLNEEIRILMARYGAAGSERIAATDYYMKQIIQILLGDVHKYIVDCAVNDSGLLGLGEWTKLDEQICVILKTTKESRVKLNKIYKTQMIQEFDTFKAVTQKFYDAYRVVQNQAKIIQKIFEKISLQFNDASIAELLLWLEQNKFSRELKKIKAEWARSVEQPQQVIGRVRKIGSCEMMQNEI